MRFTRPYGVRFSCSKRVNWIALLALMVWGTAACSDDPGRAADQTASLDLLRASLPNEANDVSLRELTLNDQRFVYASYDAISPYVSYAAFGPRPIGSVVREFDEIYRWEGRWRRVFSSYDVAQTFFSPEVLGPVGEGKPVAGTALLGTNVHIPRKFDESSNAQPIDDVLIVEMWYIGGPSDVQHMAPTIAVLAWSGDEFLNLWHEEFPVRATMTAATIDGRGLTIIIPAYAEEDRMCCPTAQAQVTLAPDTDLQSVGVTELKVIHRQCAGCRLDWR